MNGTVKASENGTKGSFDPKTYYPEPKFSSSVIAERLKRSILNEVSEEEAASRIELAAAYRMFALKVVVGSFRYFRCLQMLPCNVQHGMCKPS